MEEPNFLPPQTQCPTEFKIQTPLEMGKRKDGGCFQLGIPPDADNETVPPRHLRVSWPIKGGTRRVSLSNLFNQMSFDSFVINSYTTYNLSSLNVISTSTTV